jgi:hypothetical protein
MNDRDSLLHDIKKAYQINGLDLYKAVDVWLDNSLTTPDMRYAIKEDSGHQVTAEFVEFLVKKAFFSEATDPRCLMTADTIEKLAGSRIVKLTPAVRANMVALGNNSFTTRYSASGVEWSIIFIDNVPHLARKDFKETEVKFSGVEEDERNID